ncbi:hypothetical protein [Desulfovibrio litoralis]|uniref:Uncharacterized protein n=1 Tax=Desulfovibrio litoralis DSM 11393 TaxID=1121455 RepID=A0A1M7T7D0_9BACT|nr:hypothetical protein [Desulfovibrio litoralis]SHN66614.1 hypothetical protein SAMN02745728_01657 [Desulfovibrio litoralis DSM 11393]
MAKIFYEIELSEYLNSNRASILKSIEDETKDYILNVNELDYVKHMLDRAKIDPLEIHTDQITVSSSEKMIPAEDYPYNFHVELGKSYKKTVFKFYVPFSGDKNLLRCKPSSWIDWYINVEVINNEFTFEIINFQDDVQAISREKDSKIQSITNQLEYVKKDVEWYNSNIESQIKSAFDSRKQRLLKDSNTLASLGVPIKKSANVPQTFSVPTPEKRKKISVNRPQVTEAILTPEPCLDKDTYNEILKLIHDMGKEFERLPSLYVGKEEEHLRDHFLMMLGPNFQGSATGETFNSTGKTDILLRYESSNVFIAECKFWRGKKTFLDTISQLLNYLTWRDSKAAVIMFVPNQDFTSVLETADSVIAEHPNYIQFLNTHDETWHNYTFHLNGDRNRLVSLAVMMYHLPK